MGIVERLRQESLMFVGTNCHDLAVLRTEAADLIEKMGEVLRDNEWGATDEGYSCCPDCGGRKDWPRYDRTPPVGHLPDCKLAACLKEIST